MRRHFALSASIIVLGLAWAAVASAGTVSVTPSPIDVGVGTVGGMATATVTVSNSGTSTLTIDSVAIGSDAAEFVVSGVPTLPTTLAVGSGFSVTVTYDPQETGTQSSSLVIDSDDAVTPSLAVTITGCVGPPAISLDTSTLAFGNLNLTTMSAASLVNITNTGCASLDVTQITLGGDDPGDFSLDLESAVGTLTSQQSQPFTATFAPTALGGRNATVTITSNDPDNASEVVAMIGDGTQGMLTLAGGPLAFGAELVGTATAAKSFTIENTGTGPMQVTAIAFSDPSYAQASGSAVPFTVGLGGSAAIGVTCDPSAVGDHDATATITTDAGSGTVALTCQGIAPMFALAPQPIAFGAQAIGTTSPPIAVEISNGGTADLVVSSLALFGNDDFASSDLPHAPFTVAAGATTTFHITFTPTHTTPEGAELNVQTNDTTMPAPSIALTGTGFTAAFTVTPTTFDFGALFVDQASPPQPVTITNTSTDAIEIASITSDDLSFVVDSRATTFLVAAGASTTFSMAYVPTTAGSNQATITVSLGGSAPTAQVAVTGMANAADDGGGTSGGCCDAGGAPVPWSSLVLASGLVAVLRRRRT